MSDRRSRAFIAAMLVSTICCGCTQGLFDNDRTTYRVAPERLKKIAMTDVVAESKAPPVDADEATRNALAKGDPMPTWPARMEISLADVRESTLKNNLDLRTQLVEPAIARRTLDAERAKFEATLIASYLRSGANQFTDPAFGDPVDSDTASLGVQVPLITGGTIDVLGQLQRVDTNGGVSLDGSGGWGSGVGFSISQPLLRNAGAAVNTASIRIAEHDGQIASARTKLETIRILADADKAYWSLYGAFRDLEVRQQQFELARAQLERARRRVLQGDAAEIEVTRAESGLGGTLENIIVATATLKERVRALKRLMNRPDLPIESETLLVPATLPNPLGLKLDSTDLANRAVENRMEMLELELSLASRAIEIEVARNQTLPVFALDYSYTPFGRGDGFGSAFSNIGDFEEDAYTFSLNGQIPLGNEVAKNRLGRAVLLRLQRLATKDARRQSIRTEVFDAVVRLETAWQRILAARLETTLAARTYEGEKRQFDVGVRTSQDVLDASARLADAQSREVNALAGWQNAMVDIAFATGTLPGMAGAQWAAIDVDELDRASWGDLDVPRE
ncbi:MAG: TolC family protein [Phycisphaerae bacterium]|nr:TolC family protein [Phycisphaerae bacterium]